MTEREDTIERIERVLKLTHEESMTVTIPRLTAERAVSMLKEQEALEMRLQHACECYEELEKELNRQPNIVCCKDCKHGDRKSVV